MGVGSWVYCASLDCRRSCVNSALKSRVEHHIPGNHDMYLIWGKNEEYPFGGRQYTRIVAS